jgi:hypothetical protein
MTPGEVAIVAGTGGALGHSTAVTLAVGGRTVVAAGRDEHAVPETLRLMRACPWSVTLTQPRESPGSGDGLSPGWRQTWACRESWHGRQGTCS